MDPGDTCLKRYAIPDSGYLSGQSLEFQDRSQYVEIPIFEGGKLPIR